MKQVYSGALFLLTIIPAIAQDVPPAKVCRVEAQYDRYADITTVQCDLIELGKGAPRLSVQANASFYGKEPNDSAKFWFGLSSFRGGATRRTEPAFKEATMVSLIVDSARLEVPVKDYTNDFFELNRLLAERARAEISREDLQKLLDAKSLEGNWGGVGFKFSNAALASLKTFISRQVFAAQTR